MHMCAYKCVYVQVGMSGHSFDHAGGKSYRHVCVGDGVCEYVSDHMYIK